MIGSYDEGTYFNLVTVIIDAKSNQPIPNAKVTIYLEKDNAESTEGFTEISGRISLSLKAGETYYIEVESPGYFPQRSDSFQIFRDHEWRMMMLGDNAVSKNDTENWLVWSYLLLVIILVIFNIRRR